MRRAEHHALLQRDASDLSEYCVLNIPASDQSCTPKREPHVAFTSVRAI